MAGRSKEKERPGIVMYFDTIRTLEKLSDKARGRFLMACLYYGKELREPSFEGLNEADSIRIETLWEQIQPRIDSDAQGWKDGIIQRKYAGYCSGCRNSEEKPMSYDEYRVWFLTSEDRGVGL